jgi:hypothetical protein
MYRLKLVRLPDDAVPKASVILHGQRLTLTTAGTSLGPTAQLMAGTCMIATGLLELSELIAGCRAEPISCGVLAYAQASYVFLCR